MLRLGHRPSISSKNIKHGELNLARSNKPLTDFSLSPKYLLNNSGPFTYIKLALHALATAFANIVLPQPGGPYNNIPALELRLNYLHLTEFYNGFNINSSNSFLRFYNAPISLNDVLGIVVKPSFFIIGLIYGIEISKSFYFIINFSFLF